MKPAEHARRKSPERHKSNSPRIARALSNKLVCHALRVLESACHSSFHARDSLGQALHASTKGRGLGRECLGNNYGQEGLNIVLFRHL